MGSVLTFDTRLEVVFDLLLHVMHHGHGSNQNDRRNYLVRVKAGMEKKARLLKEIQKISRHFLGANQRSRPQIGLHMNQSESEKTGALSSTIKPNLIRGAFYPLLFGAAIL